LQKSASGRQSPHHNLASVLSIRGGQQDLKAALDCNELMTSVLADVSRDVNSLRDSLSGGEPILNFGSKADRIVNNALEKFDAETPEHDVRVKKLYADKRTDLEAAIQNSLSPLFVEQICMLKGMALETFLKGLSGDDDGSSAMVAAENAFVKEAMASVPASQSWSFAQDRDNLVRSMQAILNERSKAKDAQVKQAQQMQTAVTYLQMQQQQMRELQAAYLGGQASKWSVSGAYRPPETDINMVSSYQNGRCNVQVQMLPQEGAELLGPHGFTRGVGPANIGLSFNVHM
jgi:hypothetical protein